MEGTLTNEVRWHHFKNAIGNLVGDAHRLMVEKGFHAPEVLCCNTPQILEIARQGLIATEVAEAIEEVRAGNDLKQIRFREDGKPEGYPAELADIVLRVADIAGAHGIDLGEAIRLKHEFNRTRPHKHGKTA
jgi:NTP pyrophosphatase (non-canonical NTP hydrolase)